LLLNDRCRPTVSSLAGSSDPTTERAVVETRNVLRSLPAIAVAAVLAGCAYQDPFSLPTLGSPGAQHGTSTTVYYGYGPYPRYGYGYGYNPYSTYPYYYGSEYLAHPYAPPAYVPYPSGPYCRDANRDGRCDVQSSAPDRNTEPDADVFERLRDRIDARAGADPTTSAPVPSAIPKRPPPAPKIAPPPNSAPQAARPAADPARLAEPPAKRRSSLIPTDEP